ncbi:hypothetical protein MKZ38_010230 [Zalerion maritima]|uniref:Uncharacterized protein n=1 Tax=Zalerion maritima TaxID=339359 RepID=A0AAD5RUB8_9PEZI|nr:hypothetical protein MKZ38_010230 [Zalerion maritima]
MSYLPSTFTVDDLKSRLIFDCLPQNLYSEKLTTELLYTLFNGGSFIPRRHGGIQVPAVEPPKPAPSQDFDERQKSGLSEELYERRGLLYALRHRRASKQQQSAQSAQEEEYEDSDTDCSEDDEETTKASSDHGEKEEKCLPPTRLELILKTNLLSLTRVIRLISINVPHEDPVAVALAYLYARNRRPDPYRVSKLLLSLIASLAAFPLASPAPAPSSPFASVSNLPSPSPSFASSKRDDNKGKTKFHPKYSPKPEIRQTELSLVSELRILKSAMSLSAEGRLSLHWGWSKSSFNRTWHEVMVKKPRLLSCSDFDTVLRATRETIRKTKRDEKNTDRNEVNTDEKGAEKRTEDK